MAPAPRLTAPRPSTPTTHAEGQQKNVEQELDTLHSSFHRHGCWAWGRGEHRDRIRPRGHRLGSSPPALAAFPARSPPRPFPPGNPRSDPRLPVPSARRPHRGGGAQRAGPRDPGTHGHRADPDPRRPLPSARACARPAATPELPGPPPRGAPRASLTSRQSCSRARASSRLLSGGPRPHLRSPTPRDALRPRVSRRLPACAPRARPARRAAPPRLQPAPSPAGWPPASLM